MGEKANVTPAERRSWLEIHENGLSYKQISIQSRRTERTVRDQVERAKRERHGTKVQTDLLKEAARQHLDDLLGVVNEMKDRAVKPDTYHTKLLPIPERREKLLREGLRQHVPKSPIWTAMETWEEGAAALDSIRRTARSSKLRDYVTAALEDHPYVVEEGYLESLVTALEHIGTGRGKPDFPYRPDRNADGHRLEWSAHTLIIGAPDVSELEEVQKLHEQQLKCIAQRYRELVQVYRKAFQRWHQAKETILDETEKLALRRMLPGTCDLCPAGNMNESKRRRRRRKTS